VEAYRRAQEAFRKNADAEERVSERFEIVNMTAWHR
jgi:hypothetical protein